MVIHPFFLLYLSIVPSLLESSPLIMVLFAQSSHVPLPYKYVITSKYHTLYFSSRWLSVVCVMPTQTKLSSHPLSSPKALNCGPHLLWVDFLVTQNLTQHGHDSTSCFLDPQHEWKIIPFNFNFFIFHIYLVWE